MKIILLTLVCLLTACDILRVTPLYWFASASTGEYRTTYISRHQTSCEQ